MNCKTCDKKLRSDNTTGYCQSCIEMSPRMVEYRRQWKKDNFISGVLASAKIRAKKGSYPFSLSVPDVTPVPERCPSCGTVLVRGLDKNIDRSPSLDKLIPERGYVAGNVAWLCNRCNRLKSDATASELRMVADWMDRQAS